MIIRDSVRKAQWFHSKERHRKNATELLALHGTVSSKIGLVGL